jgi:hypothetical protein
MHESAGPPNCAGWHRPPRQIRQLKSFSVFLLKDVLTATTKSGCDGKDLVGGKMQNGKRMRQGDFKAVSVAPPYGSGTWHLNIVVDDPGETRDLAREHSEKLKQLQAAWDRYAKDVGVVMPRRRNEAEHPNRERDHKHDSN